MCALNTMLKNLEILLSSVMSSMAYCSPVMGERLDSEKENSRGGEYGVDLRSIEGRARQIQYDSVSLRH